MMKAEVALAVEPAFVARVRLRARRHARWLRSIWTRSDSPLLGGAAIDHDEADRILQWPAEGPAARAAFFAADGEARALADAIAAVDEAAAREPRMSALRRALRLADAEVDLLSMVVAAEIDPSLRRAYAYLQDAPSAIAPTAYLAAQIFDWDPAIRIGPRSPLVTWLLARPIEQARPWSQTAAWAADAPATAWLLNGDPIDPTLAQATLRAPADAPAECLYPGARDDVLTFLRATLPTGPVVVELAGPIGAGKRSLAAQIAAAMHAPLVTIDLDQLEDRGEALIRAARSARLVSAALFVASAHLADVRHLRALEQRLPLVFLGASSPMPSSEGGVALRKAVRLPSLTRAARVALWSSLSAAPPPRPVTEWTLLPSDIAAAARAVSAGDDAVAEVCRATPEVLGHLVTRLRRPYQWDDLVVSPAVRRHLEEIEAQARLRWPVYEEWGFERLCSLGRGISALFAGPSGTGKTMAAQVLARRLGMELYRVDIAGVMSKYIGETEKNLRQIFDACEHAHILLFFDEADALFGQRMKVNDAHDRFANIEIDYLLQRMEQYDGLAVLATNRKGEVDPAFLRRVRFIVDFTSPGPAERMALWKRALLPVAPNGDELLEMIDWELLASRLDMTGADIKGAALGAAFLARTDGGRITMRHLLRACRREMAKHGVVLRVGDGELA